MGSNINRRRFAQRVGATALGLLTAPVVVGAARPRVMVIGGGPGGLGVARRLAASGAVHVTLVEEHVAYSSCFFSNRFIGGLRSFESITHSYDGVRALDGLTVVQAVATEVDVARRLTHLADGSRLGWDRLVVAPGIDFLWDEIEGYDIKAAEVMPHAYRGGTQARTLRQRIETVPDGGLFIVAPPRNPYRCPPGPYERVSAVAHWFSQHRPRAKILIIDAKNEHSKQSLFQRGWAYHYPGMVEWLPAEMTDGGVVAVRPASMEVLTADETFRADAVNLIPPQKAGAIAARTGLTDDTGWCPVDPFTMASTLSPGVHVVGDAIVPGDMSRSAFAANSQARVCAGSILADLAGTSFEHPGFVNTCWSLLTPDDVIKLSGVYRPTDHGIERVEGFLSSLDDSAEVRATNARDARDWYTGLTGEMFR